MSELDPQDSGNDTEADKEIESLSDDEKAAFEKIMAEIATATGAPSKSSSDSEIKSTSDVSSARSDEPADALAPREQENEGKNADLDQIMAEIATKRNPEAAAPKQEEADLSGDQQAALDQIMAEIESKRKGESKETEKPSIGSEEASDLSNDQQAALDQIMAEIESKRSSGKEPAVNTPSRKDDDVENENLQADVENILAQAKSRKAREKGPDDSVATFRKTAAESPRKQDNLSMQEFDDELNQLLNSAKEDFTPLPIAHPKRTPAALKPAPEVMPDYPILQEVKGDSDTRSVSAKTKRTGLSGLHLQMRTVAAGFIVLALLILIPVGGYFTYLHFSALSESPAPDVVVVETHQVEVEPAMEEAPRAVATVATSPPLARQIKEMETPAGVLAGLKNDLSDARSRIQRKIYEVEQLKRFYLRGVAEESEKIEDALEGGRIPSLEVALTNKKIELPLRAIQRRRTYAEKLQTPLDQLQSISEELLFFQRRAHVYEIVNSGITGLPVEAFRKEVADVIYTRSHNYEQMSIDDVEIQGPGMAVLWAELVARFEQKANLLAQRAPLNRAIGAEICKGKYERTHLLTALSAETANCLARWPGKDIFLNDITELSPDAAMILSQWPGEWLSLNGVRELSAEAADYLSQWKGRRLSLNGLVALSPEATGHLSRWQGAQLEMVGLRAIGSWRNYGTRLFLSEDLRRQLEAQ